MISMEKTFDQVVYEETASNIVENIVEGLIESNNSETGSNNNQEIDRMVYDIEFSENIRTMYSKYHNADCAVSLDVTSSISSYMEIFKVGKFDMSISQCVDMTIEILKTSKDKLYGILLSTSSEKSGTGKSITFNAL